MLKTSFYRCILHLVTLGSAVLLPACRENPAGSDATDASTPQAYNPDWTAASHGNGTPPNYSAVFPQEAVNAIEITMTSAQWTAIRANMRVLWGVDFGGAGGAVPGGGFHSVEPDYQSVSVKFNGKVWKNVGYRLKGNSSLSQAWRQGNYKLPFRLQFDEFEDSIPAIKNQRLFGFKEVSMSPGWSDASLIREKVTADIFRAAGIPAAQTAFYRVSIDLGAGLKYCGVYTMVEVIDDTMVKEQFGEDAGNIYKPESNFTAFRQEQFEKKNNETAPNWTDVQSTIAALMNPIRTSNPQLWRSGLEAGFNIDHFIKWLAVNNAIVNWDTYGAISHNYYLYNHSAKGLTWIPWDHNQSMTGNPGITLTPGAGTGPGGRSGLSLSMNEVANNWPLIRLVADDAVYLKRYHDHLRAFRDDVFSESRMNALFDKYHALVTPHAIGANGEQPGYTYLQSSAAFTSALPALKAHVTARRALLAQFLP